MNCFMQWFMIAVSFISWAVASTYVPPMKPEIVGHTYWIKKVDVHNKLIEVENAPHTTPAAVVEASFPGYIQDTFHMTHEQFNDNWFSNMVEKFNRTRGKRAAQEMSDYLATGLSNGFKLKMNLFQGPKNWDFGTHVHKNIEYMFVLAGTLHEFRSTGHIYQFDRMAELPNNGSYEVEVAHTGNFEINEVGSVHTSYTLDDGMMLLTMFSGDFFYNINGCAHPGILETPLGVGKSPNVQTIEQYCNLNGQYEYMEGIGNLTKLYQAVNASDVNLASNLFTDDGIYMHEGFPTAVGKEAVKKLWRGLFTFADFGAHLTILDIQVARPRSGKFSPIQAIIVKRSGLQNWNNIYGLWRDTIFISGGQIEAMQTIRASPDDPDLGPIVPVSRNASFDVDESQKDKYTMMGVVADFVKAQMNHNPLEMQAHFSHFPIVMRSIEKSQWGLCQTCGTAPLITSYDQLLSYFESFHPTYVAINHRVVSGRAYGELGFLVVESSGCGYLGATNGTPLHLRSLWVMVKENGQWKINSLTATNTVSVSSSLPPPTDHCPEDKPAVKSASVTCRSDVVVGRCLGMGCFSFKHGKAVCHGTQCLCAPGYCSTNNATCIPEEPFDPNYSNEFTMATRQGQGFVKGASVASVIFIVGSLIALFYVVMRWRSPRVFLGYQPLL